MKKIDIIDFQAIEHPICYDGNKNNIPNDATGSNLASLQEGFPEITEKKISENGLPPVRKDFNGLFYISTDLRFNLQNGCFISFRQNVSDAIGGYPKDAILYFIDSNNNFRILRSLIDDNNFNFVTNETLIDNIHWQEVEIDGDISNYSNIKIYNKNSFCKIDGNIYKSLTNNNIDNNPVNDNINWINYLINIFPSYTNGQSVSINFIAPKNGYLIIKGRTVRDNQQTELHIDGVLVYRVALSALNLAVAIDGTALVPIRKNSVITNARYFDYITYYPLED